MLIHHIGAKSGTERVTPVGCFPQSDGRFAIIASDFVRLPGWTAAAGFPALIIQFCLGYLLRL